MFPSLSLTVDSSLVAASSAQMESVQTPFLSGETTDDSGDVKVTDLDDEAILQCHIAEMRRRVEELTAALTVESKGLARLERLLHALTRGRKRRGKMSWETLGTLLSRRNFRLSSKLASWCGAGVLAKLSCVDTEIR
jgi:DNA-binding GntR family transcriptional regulator